MLPECLIVNIREQAVEKVKLAERIYSTNQSDFVEKHLISQSHRIGLFVTMGGREYGNIEESAACLHRQANRGSYRECL
jgi:hypothetical protein